jgi:hypothetical protein
LPLLANLTPGLPPFASMKMAPAFSSALNHLDGDYPQALPML